MQGPKFNSYETFQIRNYSITKYKICIYQNVRPKIWDLNYTFFKNKIQS